MKKTLVSVMLLALASISAQENAHNIAEVVVQGKFMDLPLKKINENIIIIGQKEIQNTPFQSIDEILQQHAGLDIRKRGGNGVQSDVSIRGGSFDQVLVLINGIRMNDSQTGHNTMTLPIDLDNVAQIEVVKGPAARRFGQNAYAGVINIVTKTHQGKNVKISAEGGDFGSYQLGFSANAGNEKFSQSIGINTAHSEGYRYNTDFDIRNIFYHNQLNIKDGKINLQAGFVEKKFGANGFYGNATAKDQYEEVQTSIVSVAYQQKLGDFRFNTNAYWRRGQDMYLWIKHRPEVYRNMHIGNNVGGEVSGSYQSELGTTSAGVELRKEFLVSTNLGERNRFVTQAFFEHHFAFFGDKLQVSPGISWANFSTNGNFFYPAVSAGFNFNDEHKIYGNVAKIHRIPSFTDLYYTSRAEIGNPSLLPENAISSEIGYRFHNKNLTAKVSGFLRNSNNAIDWIKYSPAGKWEAQNIGKMETKGVELEFNHRANDWLNYSVGYTFIDNQRKNTEQFASKYALNNLKHQLVANLETRFLKHFSNQLTYRYHQRLNLDSYHLLDGKLSFHKNNYKLYLLVNNITNTQYSETGVDVPVPMAGRWFHIGMNYNINFK